MEKLMRWKIKCLGNIKRGKLHYFGTRTVEFSRHDKLLLRLAQYFGLGLIYTINVYLNEEAGTNDWVKFTLIPGLLPNSGMFLLNSATLVYKTY